MRFSDWFQASSLPMGIDIGASGVRMLQFRRQRGSLVVSAAARVEIPGADDPGSEAYARQVAQAISSRLESGEFSGRRCVVSLDDRLLRVRSIRQPRIPDDELEKAVRLDAPNRLGFSETEHCEVGWVRAGEVRQGDDVRDEIILVGVRREAAERIIFALSSVGLCPLALEPGFVACARNVTRTLRRTADQNTVKVMVDIGMRSTGVTVVRGQTVGFHKPLEMGGATMIAAAASRLGLEPAAVMDLRRRRTTPGAAPIDQRVERALFEAVRPTMVDLANEVSLCLRYFGVSFRGARPECCYLVGGEALEPRLDEIVGEAVHLPTSLGHPLGAMRVSPRAAAICGELDSPWAVAAGLGLRMLRAPAAARDDRRDSSARQDTRADDPAGSDQQRPGANGTQRRAA